MKSNGTKIILGVVILLVVGGVFAILYSRARAQSASTSSLETATVKLGDIATSVTASGSVHTRQTAVLNWQNTGTVGSVDVKVGDVVTSGQVLATLSTDQMPQNVVEAEADLAAAQQNLKTVMTSTTPQVNAQKALQDAKDALANYQNNFPAIQAEAKASLITAENDLTEAQNQWKNIQYAKPSAADIAAAQAKVVLAQRAVDNAKKAYDQVAKLKNDDPRLASALTNLSDAAKKLSSAQSKLAWYQTYPTAQDLDNAKANVMAAEANLAKTQQEWDSVKDGPDTAQMAVLQAAVDDAQRAYDQVKDGPNPNDVASANARIAGDQSTIDTMKIIAPFDGTITSVSVLPHDQVSSGGAAFQIDDLSHLLIDVTVAETDLPKIKLDQAVKITFSALSGKSYQGKVVDIAQVGTSNQGVVTFGVTVEITNPDADVRAGMSANLSIIIASKQNTLTVPTRAVQSVGGQHTITVLFEGNQITIPVTVGIASSTETEITGGGLKQGDVVVLNPTTTTTRNGARFFAGPGGGGQIGPGPGGFGD